MQFAAEKALELDPLLSQAHDAQGMVYARALGRNDGVNENIWLDLKIRHSKIEDKDEAYRANGRRPNRH